MPAVPRRRAMLAVLASPALLAGCGFGVSPAATTATPGGTPAGSTPVASPSVAITSGAAAGTPARASGTSVPTGGPAATPAATRPAASGFAGQLDLANPRQGGRLVEGWLNDARTLNPAFVTDIVSGHATSLLFNGLVKLNPDTLQPEGDLAVSWQVAADSQGYTFRLRPNVTFHDGQPFTADDVKFTYDLLLNERANPPRRAELAAVLESVTVISPSEVEFRLKSVHAPFLAIHAGYGILPRHLLGMVDPGAIEQSDFSLLRPVGTGPFQFKDWQRGASLTLSRAPSYYAGQPYLDEVVLKTVASQEVIQTQLRIGEIDIATVPEAATDELRRQQNLTLAPVDSLSITYLGFQLDPARTTLFQDKRVRQALAGALDREAILRIVRHGIGRLATGSVPPPLWAASDRLTGQVTYDPSRAEQMLETAGWRKEADGIRARDGKKLSFELLTNRGAAGNRLREQYAQMIQDDWRKIGVEARPVLVDFQEVVNRLRRTHEFDVYLTSFAFEADPDQRVLWSTDAYRTGFNASRYSNATLDQLLTDAVQTLAQDRRRDLYLRAQETLLDEMPAVVLDYPRTVHAVAKRLRNVIPNVASLSYNAHQWWLAEGP